MPSPEFGSVFCSANCASIQLMQLFHQRPAMLLMEAQPLLRRQSPVPAPAHRSDKRRPASPAHNGILRESSPPPPQTCRLPCARQLASRISTPSSFGVLRDSASHIWIGAGSSACALFQHLGQILARMLPPGEVQRDAPCAHHRYDAAGEGPPVALVARLARPGAESACPCRRCASPALRRLPDQFLQRRLDQVAAASIRSPIASPPAAAFPGCSSSPSSR